MPVPVGSVFDLQSKRIQEVISTSIGVFMASMDPIWKDVAMSSQGVGNSSALGRGMEIRKVFMNATAGVIESGAPRGDHTMYGDANQTSYDGLFNTTTETQVFPDANEDPSGLPFSLRIPMKSIQTNMKMTLGESQAEALSAFIGQITAPRTVAFARNVARRLCSSWYTSQAENYRLAGLGPSSGTLPYTVDGAGKKITFYPSNRAVSRFAVGDRVDIYRNFSGTPVRMNDDNVTAGGVVAGDATVGPSGTGQKISTRIKAFISKVNKVEGWVTIVFDPATNASKFTTTGSLTASQLANDSYLVWANSGTGAVAFTDFPGLHSWLKFGGSTAGAKQLLGDEALGTVGDGIIDVSVYPQFQSFYKNVNNVLTEHRLNLYLDRVTEAFEDEGDYIDTVITTQGVIRAAAAQKYAQMRLDRTGKVSSLTNEGEDGKGMVHTHNGRAYTMRTSRWMEYGSLIGIRAAGNWTRYTPPATPGAQSGAGVEPGIPFEFLAPAITGMGSTRFPMLNGSGNLTGASQLPGHVRMTLVPEKQVRGMKLANLTEERVDGERFN